MLWDSLILLLAVWLAFNGWKRGGIRCWRGLVAIVIATIIAQQTYVDFSTWLLVKLRTSPQAAVLLGYLMLWFSLQAIFEIVLALLFKGTSKARPIFIDRLGGIAYGLSKAFLIIILPLMASAAPLKIPPPPADRTYLQLPDFALSKSSLLVPGFQTLGQALLPVAGRFVVSDKAPSFTPQYAKPVRKPDAAGEAEHGQDKEIDKLLQ